MAATPQSLLQDALELPEDDRAALADELLESIDRPESEFDASWLDEAKSRLAAYRRGEIEAVDAEIVFDQLSDAN